MQPTWTRPQIWTVQICKAIEAAVLVWAVGLTYWASTIGNRHTAFQVGTLISAVVVMGAASYLRAKVVEGGASRTDRGGLVKSDHYFRAFWFLVPWCACVVVVNSTVTTNDWYPVIVASVGAALTFARSLADAVFTYPTPGIRVATPDPAPTIRELIETPSAQWKIERINHALDNLHY